MRYILIVLIWLLSCNNKAAEYEIIIINQHKKIIKISTKNKRVLSIDICRHKSDFKNRLFLLFNKRISRTKYEFVIVVVAKNSKTYIVEMKKDNFMTNYWQDGWYKFDIDAYGNIYQLWSDKKGVYVTKWELIEK